MAGMTIGKRGYVDVVYAANGWRPVQGTTVIGYGIAPTGDSPPDPADNVIVCPPDTLYKQDASYKVGPNSTFQAPTELCTTWWTVQDGPDNVQSNQVAIEIVPPTVTGCTPTSIGSDIGTTIQVIGTGFDVSTVTACSLSLDQVDWTECPDPLDFGNTTFFNVVTPAMSAGEYYIGVTSHGAIYSSDTTLLTVTP